MAENRQSSISQADSYEKMGEFWDIHDFTEFDTTAPDIEFTVQCAVPVDEELFFLLEDHAKKQGITVKSLVTLWLQQKLQTYA